MSENQIYALGMMHYRLIYIIIIAATTSDNILLPTAQNWPSYRLIIVQSSVKMIHCRSLSVREVNVFNKASSKYIRFLISQLGSRNTP